MKITNMQVFGFESAIRGMRNPKNSWDRSDSVVSWDLSKVECEPKDINSEDFVLGQADQTLSQQLTKAGGEHCKHLRMIQVWFDLDAPRYMWAEFDTYKHTEKISCSTMHKMFERELTIDDFEADGTNEVGLRQVLYDLDYIRRFGNGTTQALIDAKTILPESFLQKRTVNTNYQQLLNIYHQRKNHRLPVWKEFCKRVKELPYFVELTGLE